MAEAILQAMCPPTDTTPDPRDMARAPDQAEFLQPRQGQQAAGVPSSPVQNETERGSAETVDAAEIELRPPLPEARTPLGTDWTEVEDEDADPVTEGGPH